MLCNRRMSSCTTYITEVKNMKKITLEDITVFSKKERRVDEARVRKALIDSGKLYTDFNNLFFFDAEQRVVENIGVAGNKAVSRVRAELFDDDVIAVLDIKRLENALKDIVAIPKLWFDSQVLKNTTLVNMQNGVLDLSDLNLKTENNGTLLFDSKLDFSFKSGEVNLKEDAPVFAQFCEQSLGVVFKEGGGIQQNEQKLMSLLQGIGYLVSNVGSFRRAVFFMGPPASGKSTILHLLARVMTPVSVVSAYNFRQLTKSFTMVSVATSKLNIVEELDCVSKVQLEAFKLLVAGGRLSGERKYQSDVEVKASVKLAVASNSLPLFEAGNLAPIIDRMHLIVFENTISGSNRDINLEDKLWEERDVIFSLALAEFSKVVQNKGEFTMDNKAATLLDRLLEETSSEEQFVKAHLELAAGNNISASKVMSAYYAFCKENAYVAKKPHYLYQAILLTFGKAGEKKKVRDPYNVGVNSVQGFSGLRLKGGEEIE